MPSAEDGDRLPEKQVVIKPEQPVTAIIQFTASPVFIRFFSSGFAYIWPPFKEQHGESKNSREEILIMSGRFKILKIEAF